MLRKAIIRRALRQNKSDNIIPSTSGLEFERWLSGCGPPLYEPDLSAGGALIQPVQELCDLWRSRNPPDTQSLTTFDLLGWSTFQIVLFLDRLLDHSPLPQGRTDSPGY